MVAIISKVTGNNLEKKYNAQNLGHNVGKLQEILNIIMQIIMSIITSVLVGVRPICQQ